MLVAAFLCGLRLLRRRQAEGHEAEDQVRLEGELQQRVLQQRAQHGMQRGAGQQQPPPSLGLRRRSSQLQTQKIWSSNMFSKTAVMVASCYVQISKSNDTPIRIIQQLKISCGAAGAIYQLQSHGLAQHSHPREIRGPWAVPASPPAHAARQLLAAAAFSCQPGAYPRIGCPWRTPALQLRGECLHSGSLPCEPPLLASKLP